MHDVEAVIYKGRHREGGDAGGQQADDGVHAGQELSRLQLACHRCTAQGVNGFCTAKNGKGAAWFPNQTRAFLQHTGIALGTLILVHDHRASMHLQNGPAAANSCRFLAGQPRARVLAGAAHLVDC